MAKATINQLVAAITGWKCRASEISLHRQASWFASQQYMLTLHQGRLKKLRMFWLGSRGVVRSCADKGLRRSHRWRSHQMPPLGQLALALSACLTIMAGTGEFARAEDPLSGKILSACRVPPRAAYGEIRKPSPEAKKGYTYDAVLRINARRALSLYGRGIVKRRKGDIAGSEADIATALAIRPGVADYMAQYGIK